MDATLRRHALSCLLHFLSLLSLSLSLSLEAYIVVGKWKPMCHLVPLSCVLLLQTLRRMISRSNQVYLVDFSCYRPPTRFRVPTSAFIEHLTLFNFFDKQCQAFMAKVVSSSGQGEETCLPTSLHYIPPQIHHEDSIEEAQMLLFSALDDLLSKTNLSPCDIDILIVNSSAFYPSPSLSSIVVNRYAMRDDIKTFNLSGMGCSASAVGVDIARSLLRLHPNSYVVILSTEILSTGWYTGSDRRKLLLNCTFRMGSAAILLTNRKEAKKKSKYLLKHVVRTHRAFDDGAYCSGILEEDSQGITGFTVGRDLLIFVAETLRSNIFSLGMSMFPLSEKIKYAVLYLRKISLRRQDEAYVPDFRKLIQHFCVPPVGVAYIKEVGRRLGLSERDIEPALRTFHRFGNQSSSSMWYQMAYMEAKERVKKGDKVWQVAIGSGPKCNSVVWESLTSSNEGKQKGPWSDRITPSI